MSLIYWIMGVIMVCVIQPVIYKAPDMASGWLSNDIFHHEEDQTCTKCHTVNGPTSISCASADACDWIPCDKRSGEFSGCFQVVQLALWLAPNAWSLARDYAWFGRFVAICGILRWTLINLVRPLLPTVPHILPETSEAVGDFCQRLSKHLSPKPCW